MPWKENSLCFPFQERDKSVLSLACGCHACSLPEGRGGLWAGPAGSTARRWCPALGQIFWRWRSGGAGTARASPHRSTHPPRYPRPRRPTQHPGTLCASAETLGNRHTETISLHQAILTILTTEEGAEPNMWADCSKPPGSAYKLQKPSETKHEA